MQIGRPSSLKLPTLCNVQQDGAPSFCAPSYQSHVNIVSKLDAIFTPYKFYQHWCDLKIIWKGRSIGNTVWTNVPWQHLKQISIIINLWRSLGKSADDKFLVFFFIFPRREGLIFQAYCLKFKIYQYRIAKVDAEKSKYISTSLNKNNNNKKKKKKKKNNKKTLNVR